MEEKKKQVTRAEVAKLAGVSETIVSYVINNNRYVAKDKRERVEEAVRTLNYRPNNVARALKGKPSNQILFIADHHQFRKFPSGICGTVYQSRSPGGGISQMAEAGVFRKSRLAWHRTFPGGQKGDGASDCLWL